MREYKIEVTIPFVVDDVETEEEALAFGEMLAQEVTYMGERPNFFNVRIVSACGCSIHETCDKHILDGTYLIDDNLHDGEER